MTEYSDSAYSDIINVQSYKAKKRISLSLEGRAAQFASFEALGTLNGAIEEKSRLSYRQLCKVRAEGLPKRRATRDKWGLGCAAVKMILELQEKRL